MPRVVRASSGVPSSASSRASRRLTIDFDMPSRAPARVRLPLSTTSVKVRISSRSGMPVPVLQQSSADHAASVAVLATAYSRGQDTSIDQGTKP